MSEKGHRTATASRISGLTRRQLDYYDRTDLVKPSIKPASGHGSRRLYSFRDIVELKTVKALRDQTSLQRIRKAVSFLRLNFPDVRQPLAELRFLSDGDSIFVLTSSANEMIDALRSGQVVLSIALGEIIKEVIEELRIAESEVTKTIRVGDYSYTATFTPEPDGSGYVATCKELKGAVSQGDTLEEAEDMITDAITMILDLLKEHKLKRTADKTE
jgi:predicted RNase H-like HicB family nuclease